MKSTYTTPVIVTRGNVVQNTLGSKSLDITENASTKKVSGGNNLSFGL